MDPSKLVDVTHAVKEAPAVLLEAADKVSEEGAREAGSTGEQAGASTSAAGAEEDDEDEGCAFCAFMKGGECKSAFVKWEKCVDECRDKDEDFSKTCFQYTMDLQTCMNKNKEYYAPMLEEEEKYAEEQMAAQAADGGADSAAGARTSAAEPTDPGSDRATTPVVAAQTVVAQGSDAASTAAK